MIFFIIYEQRLCLGCEYVIIECCNCMTTDSVNSGRQTSDQCPVGPLLLVLHRKLIRLCNTRARRPTRQWSSLYRSLPDGSACYMNSNGFCEIAQRVGHVFALCTRSVLVTEVRPYSAVMDGPSINNFMNEI